MSKHLKEVFASRFQFAFLGTVQPEPCNVKGTMEIIVEEVNDDGSPWLEESTRFVKICHSQNECIHCEIPVDPKTGRGSITLSDMTAMKYVIVQVDACGTQMINKDAYEILYKVDQEEQQEDYAQVTFTQVQQHVCVHIINQRMPKAELRIQKSLRTRDGKALELCDDMEFLVRISSSDCFERFVKLNGNNHFCEELKDLRSGIYTIEEYEYCDYQSYYRLNGMEETSTALFELSPGRNTLDIINEERVNTQLTLEKYVRNACGELCKPSCFEEFEVWVRSNQHEECVILCEENDFCATLYGLAPGFYDVKEVGCQPNLYETTYIVNDCDESIQAQVELCENRREEVWIINTTIENEVGCGDLVAPLRISKYIRRCDGRIVQPEEGEQFKVMVRGCGMNEAFYLNANNNFCVDLANLCIGEYEICEISCKDYTTSYCINKGKERTSARICYDGSENFCVAIINEERNRGSICISKYIRNEFGDLTRPDKHQCFKVTLSSYFCKRCFELNADNDFHICFHDLRFGSYEVREEELCEYETRYQVNCDKECRHARLMIDNCCENEVKIINSVARSNCGILKISKFVETLSKELVRPARDEEFEIEVEGPCFCETYVLRAVNNWCIQLEGLEEGEYQIRECQNNCYETTYLVNREMCEDAIVYMGECNQEVCIVNRPLRSGTLTIDACVRTCDGDMIKPLHDAAMEVLVESSDECFSICLDVANNWCVELDELCEGKYRIIQKDNMGYKVSYIVHGREDSFGKIQLGSQDEQVTIINEETACMGSVVVTKFIEARDGTLSIPCPQDEFHFELNGRCFTRTYTLRKRNDFCIYFDDLDEGDYEIRELDDCFDVTYRINGECVDRACFTLGREDVAIDIINRVHEEGCLHIEKRIRKGNSFVKPSCEDCFQILLKGKNTHEIYELNTENDFCLEICGLNKQHYEVSELSVCGKVSYDVDGNMQEEGYFLFTGDDIDMIIINEEMLYGCMEIKKVIAGDNGRLLRPNRYECFEVIVESDAYKQKVLLNKENDFCVRLYDLPQGHYEVRELDNECCVSYLINDLPYESACVDVCEEDVCITIINHPCVKGSLQFHGVIDENGCELEPSCGDVFCIKVSNEGCCEEILLDADNHFCKVLNDLKPGSYLLQESGSDPISFHIEGQCFDDEVCVELNGEDVCVEVVRHKSKGVDVTIHKCMMDAYGNLFQPEEQECFEVTLTHHDCVETIVLNAQNHFTKIVENLMPGHFEVKEQHAEEALYQINDQGTKTHGRFEVKDHDVQVMIINKVKSFANLQLEARIQDCEGRLLRPCGEMCFEVDVQGEGVQEKIILDCHNNWHQKCTLVEGSYQLVQKMDERFCDLYYLINDQKCNEGNIVMRDEDQYVTTLNVECCARGSIELCKLIRDQEGCYRYPDEKQSFWITIQGEQDNNRVLLNAENHFYASVRGLRDGWYEVKEEQGAAGVEYIVNNAAPNDIGRVRVAGNANTINIINPMQQTPSLGSIQIAKFISDGAGGGKRPSEGEYRIHISKPGYNELFSLNAENNYRMLVENLEDGLYVVDEVDHENVTYMVNGGSVVDQAIVEVSSNANQVDIFNPGQENSGGSITMAKYIRVDSQLTRPTGNDSFVFLLSRPGFHQLYTLDQSNQWMTTINGLADGDYVLSETTNTNRVSYIINGSSEVDRAVISVRSNTNSVQIINASTPAGIGSIHIEKFIRDGMRLQRPENDFTAQIFISKPGYNEVFTLDASNNWMVDVSNLDNGFYVIDEVGSNDEVSYIINGGSEVSNGVVQVENNNNMVMMINTQNEVTSSIQIAKFIRTNDGSLQKPSGSARFIVEVSGDQNYHKLITLDQSNEWTTTLSDLDNGYYEVEEISNQGYGISYIVDNGLETGNASLRLLDNDHSVSIINSSGDMLGRLKLNKWIKNADGTLIRPADGDVFFVEISNENTLRRVQLDSGNMFTSVVQDLPHGEYRVREVEGLNYLVTYRVNGGSESVNASVIMNTGINNTIDIYNELRGNRNTIEVFKYMLDNVGNYLPPTAPDVYSFTIMGLDNGISETYELNVDNSWHQSLRTLPSGRYQVKENGTSAYPIRYLINSADLKDEAIFTANPGSTSVIGIINVMEETGQGTIVFTKRMRGASGTLTMPENGEVFSVSLSSAQYNQVITLEPENNYTFTVSDLPFGIYQIEEVSSDYQIVYRINEGVETSNGIIQVDSSSMNVALIINSPLPTTNVAKPVQNSVKVVIE